MNPLLLFIVTCIYILQIDAANMNPANDKDLQTKITWYHNSFRIKVKPTASNMRAMRWSPEAARVAQNHANKCLYGTHSKPSDRNTRRFGQCGESLSFFSLNHPKANWYSAIKLWNDERSKFKFGDESRAQSMFSEIGHYTSLVWATTGYVGCGYKKCGNFHNFVCSYCPSGNIQGQISRPYKIGRPCGSCPNKCWKRALCL